MTDEAFIQEVKKEMRAFESHAVTSTGDRFAVWFACRFLDLDPGDVVNRFHIGSAGDEKADIGIVDDQFPTKMIIQCKYSDSPLTKNYGKNEIDEVLNARRRVDTAPEDGNERRRQFVQDFRGSKLPEKVIIVAFGGFTTAPRNNAYEYARANDVHLYDFERLKREYLRITNPTAAIRPREVYLPFDENRFFMFDEGSTKAYFMIIPTESIYELVRDVGDGIFEENLRFQLPKTSLSSLIAGEIKRTLEDRPMEFAVLNNGVTFICERAEINTDNLKLVQPQIINGCQTAYAIFEMYESWRKGGKETDTLVSYLPTKIIETDINDAERIRRISNAANLQNPITSRNRYSNDELQRELSNTFVNVSKKIFYDYKDGGWGSVLRSNTQSLFKVPGVRGRVYRTIKNQLVGQIYLALMGKPQIAGNQKGIIFSDEKFYNAVFNYQLSSSDRFSRIALSPSKVMLSSGEENFIDDVLFGFRVYRLLEAMGQHLYPRKIGSYSVDLEDPNYQYYEKVAVKEFVKYWHFHVIRMLHEIVYLKTSGDPVQTSEVRRNLVTDEFDLFFSPVKKIATEFKVEERPQKYTILDIANPSEDFPLYGKWISNLEQVVYDVVAPERVKPDWKGFNHFFYKREATLDEIRRKVTDILGGVDSDLKFPLE
ncbi:hypothetical protein E3J62_09555 [candidate division TA06 bacterium]|uniref:Abortive phage infection protein C-terminal domain-containing protein n=1 Tax=candidate division TA06 bacterium TaxID=2250710 RepID=A0A523UQN8_UNCT6|nr:MAG: hypothetical protein E3J62_09555 [candidate division TA06 bacterium]